MNSKLRTGRIIPWEVKWAQTMNMIKDLFNKIEFQPEEKVEIKHIS